jgi:hypothetical protein
MAAQFVFRNSSISAYSFPNYSYNQTHSTLQLYYLPTFSTDCQQKTTTKKANVLKYY